MKRIARSFVFAALASTATIAAAANTSYPSSAQEVIPFSQEFPNMDSWKREHRDSVAMQPSVGYPASAQEEYPLAQEFPNMGSYQQAHGNDPVQASNTPTFPYSVPDEPSFYDEGIVPGVAGVSPYEGSSAVGGTR